MKYLTLLFSLLLLPQLHAQSVINTPTYHVDTITFLWNGKTKDKMRTGSWEGQCRIFKDKAYANYVNGKPDGSWLVQYSNGKIREQGQFVNGVKDGTWITYNNLGDTTLFCNYTMGVLDGKYKTYYVANLPTRIGSFVNGQKEGTWIVNTYTAQRKLWVRKIYNFNNDVLDGETKVITYAYMKTSMYENGLLLKADSISTADSTYVNEPWPSKEEPVLSFVEEMPYFKGGPSAFNQYLQENIRYPRSAMEKNKQGTVYVEFIVEKDGTVTNVNVKKGVKDAPELDAEAVRVVAAMPKWEPGKLRGQPARVIQVYPIKFSLE